MTGRVVGALRTGLWWLLIFPALAVLGFGLLLTWAAFSLYSRHDGRAFARSCELWGSLLEAMWDGGKLVVCVNATRAEALAELHRTSDVTGDIRRAAA